MWQHLGDNALGLSVLLGKPEHVYFLLNELHEHEVKMLLQSRNHVRIAAAGCRGAEVACPSYTAIRYSGVTERRHGTAHGLQAWLVQLCAGHGASMLVCTGTYAGVHGSVQPAAIPRRGRHLHPAERASQSVCLASSHSG